MESNEAVSMCLLMLKEECGKDNVQQTLQTILKILRNIEQNPTVEKFRRIRKENKTFSDKVWKFDSAQQFLYSIGWIEAEDSIILPENDHVPVATTLLEQALKECGVQVEKKNEQINPSPQSELTEKEKQLAENRRLIMERLKRDKQEKEQLKEQIKADRRDVSTRESKDSKARNLTHGGTMTKFEDIGINLNKGSG